MAGWILKNQKSGVELMQNCDLPPPVKVFAGSDRTVISSMNRICNLMGRKDDGDEFNLSRYGAESDKLELLKALQSSQTRAREAEAKNDLLAKERDSVCNAFLKESLQVLAYRQWVRLLEFQVTKLQIQRENRLGLCAGCRRRIGTGEWSAMEDDGGENDGGIKWVVALALCLGIAGVGFAFGCRYLH